MEAVGLAASVISIGSLVIQILRGLNTASEFLESIEEAPSFIRRISRELRLLMNLLATIEHEFKDGRIQNTSMNTMQEALTIAKQDVDKLASLVSELARGIRPEAGRFERHWKRLKVVLKAEKIAKMTGHIENAKSILNLVQTSRIQSAICQMDARLDLITSSFKATLTPAQVFVPLSPTSNFVEQPGTALNIGNTLYSLAQLQNASPKTMTRTKCFDIGFGTFYFRSTSPIKPSARDPGKHSQADEDNQFRRKIFVVQFLWKFASCRKGVRICTRNSFDQWTLNTIQRRPNNSKIFLLCRKGDLEGVRQLLHNGDASLYDVDETGCSLLHYACRRKSAKLCLALIELGADVYYLNDKNIPPIVYVNRPRNEFTSLDKSVIESLDVMIHRGGFDPFSSGSGRRNHKTQFYLPDGLPFEILESLLEKTEFYPTPEQRICFAHLNSFYINNNIYGNEKSLDLLLYHYEAVMDKDPGVSSLLPSQLALRGFCAEWLAALTSRSRRREDVGSVYKISRALKLTKDLFRFYNNLYTVLDLFCTHAGGHSSSVAAFFRRWLQLLADNGIDITNYGRFEEQHRQSIESVEDLEAMGPERITCCRVTLLKFSYGVAENSLTIEPTNVVHPKFAHLAAEYMCENGRGREHCLSKLDEALVRDGQPLPGIPGSWGGTFKPNSELSLVHRWGRGWIYVEEIKRDDRVWDEDGDGYGGSEDDLRGDSDLETDRSDEEEDGDDSSNDPLA